MKNHKELQERWKYFLDNFTTEDWKNFKQGESVKGKYGIDVEEELMKNLRAESVKGNKYDKMLNKLKEALEKETPESYNAWFDKFDEFEENIKSRMESGTLDINELNKEYEEFFNSKK